MRLSGPNAIQISESICVRKPKAGSVLHTAFRDRQGNALDDGLVLAFLAPASFTGEDVVEFQGHGSPVVLSSLVAECVALGAELARPGEFSERAFLNGRMDLAQAEAVADLIHSTTRAAARAAERPATPPPMTSTSQWT